MEKKTNDGNLTNVWPAEQYIPINCTSGVTDYTVPDAAEQPAADDETVERVKQEVDDNHK